MSKQKTALNYGLPEADSCFNKPWTVALANPVTVSPTLFTPLAVFAKVSRPFAVTLHPTDAGSVRRVLPADIISAALIVSSSFRTSSPTERAQTMGSAVAE